MAPGFHIDVRHSGNLYIHDQLIVIAKWATFESSRQLINDEMNCLMAGVVPAYISTLRQKAAYRFRQFKDKVSKSMKMSSILGQFKESG